MIGILCRVSQMLTVKEASERLRVSTSLIYGLCARGLIAHHRCGLGRGTIRISEEALHTFLDRSMMIVQSRPQGSVKKFSQLDSPRLAEAWKERGIA